MLALGVQPSFDARVVDDRLLMQLTFHSRDRTSEPSLKAKVEFGTSNVGSADI